MRQVRHLWWMLICLASCASDSVVVDYEVSGYVTDRMSGDAIEGATVSFVSDTRFSVATTTDENGLYQMAVETDRPFGQVAASAPGYETGDTTVFFDTRTRRVDLDLRSE